MRFEIDKPGYMNKAGIHLRVEIRPLTGSLIYGGFIPMDSYWFPDIQEALQFVKEEYAQRTAPPPVDQPDPPVKKRGIFKRKENA